MQFGSHPDVKWENSTGMRTLTYPAFKCVARRFWYVNSHQNMSLTHFLEHIARQPADISPRLWNRTGGYRDEQLNALIYAPRLDLILWHCVLWTTLWSVCFTIHLSLRTIHKRAKQLYHWDIRPSYCTGWSMWLFLWIYITLNMNIKS